MIQVVPYSDFPVLFLTYACEQNNIRGGQSNKLVSGRLSSLRGLRIRGPALLQPRPSAFPHQAPMEAAISPSAGQAASCSSHSL